MISESSRRKWNAVNEISRVALAAALTLSAASFVPAAVGAPREQVKARYLRFEIPTQTIIGVDKRGMYRMMELEVHSGGTNVARQANISASEASGDLSKLIDGSNHEYILSACSLPEQVNPWIELDLGREWPVEKIMIYGKGSMTKGTKVWLVSTLDETRRISWYQRFELVGPNKNNRFIPKPFSGRYTGSVLAEKSGSWYKLEGEQENERKVRTIVLELGPAPDLSQRRAAFTGRDSEAEVAALCRRFAAALAPDVKGLGPFYELVDKGEHRRALDAYRTFFFDRLANPEKYGIPADLRIPGDVLDSTIDALAVDSAMRGQRVNWGGNYLLVAEVGHPGATRWAPGEANGRVVSEEEQEFFSMPNHIGAPRFIMFDDLLKSYIATGDRSRFDRWQDYLDEWCLYGRKELLASRFKLAMGTEVPTRPLFGEFMRWRDYLKHRPAFAKELRSTTLVRYMLSVIEDIPPFMVRARRAELANWGAMGINGLAHLSVLFPEFEAMRFYANEAARLSLSSFIQQRTMDGENNEAVDWGHRFTDLTHNIRDTLSILPLMPLDPALDLTDPLSITYAADQFFTVYRNLLMRVTPDGYDWPCWPEASGKNPAMDVKGCRSRINLTCTVLLGNRNVPKCVWDKAAPTPMDVIEKEAEAAARMAALMGCSAPSWVEAARSDALSVCKGEPPSALANLLRQAKPAALSEPERISDPAPYSGMYFLRDAWTPGAESFFQYAFPARTQGDDVFALPKDGQIMGYGAMRYDLLKEGRPLVLSEAIAIDKKAPNGQYGAVRSGGKVTYSVMPRRQVIDTRFHSSSLLEMAEARRNDPYSRRENVRGDWYNMLATNSVIDNTPLFGVTASRQIFHVRGEGIWIVADRIENPSEKEHEYSAFWTYPALVTAKGMSKTVRDWVAAGFNTLHEEKGRIRTAIPGFANLSTYLFGPEFRMINRLRPDGAYETFEKTQLQVIKEALDNGIPEATLMLLDNDPAKCLGLRQVGILWKGTGNQALVTLHYTREPMAKPEDQFKNELREIEPLTGAKGVTGFRALTHKGVPVFFQSGPGRVNALAAGAARVRGESLLAIEKDGGIAGVALGTDGAIALRDKQYRAGTADFEYRLNAQSRFTSTPIHGMIDTVRILPEPNVFSDRLEVSFVMPDPKSDDLELRYTTDGSDPTLASALYTGPFTISKTLYVKVRPFRKGLKETPWNIPGELAGKTVGAIFRKAAPLPALPIAALKPGLDYEYFEDSWPTLFTHAAISGVLAPVKHGSVSGLLNAEDIAGLRATDQAYAVRYTGYVEIPETGVYSFHAPEHLLTPTMDAGFDLRVKVGGREWFPSPTLHSENVWSVALEKGCHALQVTYVDYRWKSFKNDYWMDWLEQQMWQGTPVLAVSGPGLAKQPLPAPWLKHKQEGVRE
jgi:hypothetical protein